MAMRRKSSESPKLENNIKLEILEILKKLPYDRAENVIEMVKNDIALQKENFNDISQNIGINEEKAPKRRVYTREELQMYRYKYTECPQSLLSISADCIVRKTDDFHKSM